MSILIETIKLMRPKHWAKNLLIFMPLFFAGKIIDFQLLYNAFISFAAFCFAASSIYIINDWKDIEKDKLHPEKKNRPLASGKIKPRTALFISGILLLFAFFIILFMFNNIWAMLILGLYVIQNLFYSFGFKNYSIIDVSMISIGFVFRIIIGGLVTEIALSHWIILLTFLLALFLAFAKRRDDLIVFEATKKEPRKSIYGYSYNFIDSALSIFASVVIVAYLMYTLSPEVTNRLGKHAYLTSFFVIVSILQYLKLTQVKQNSSNPVELLFKNLFLQLLILGWLISFVLLIYFGKVL